MMTARQAEVAVVLTLVAISVLLRVWQPGLMAVEHFDEGVYASNLLCEFNAFHFPNRHLYAPPLLPALLEWALIVSGGVASSVMWVNVIVGCLMVPSVWWVGRAWFGPSAGLTAAALAAFSDVHTLYSRTALTDPLLCLWMLWGVYFAWRAVLSGLPSQVIAAAALASLAWWTKYNGWLTLAISGSGMLTWLAFSPAGSRDWRAVLRWLVVAGIAVACWAPVLIDLRAYGGYAAVAENHSGYFVGWSGWTGSFLRQAANLRHWKGVLGPLQTLLLLLVMFPPYATVRLRMLFAIGSACLLLLSTHALLALLSVLGLAWVLWESRPHNDTQLASGGRVRSVADGPAITGPGLPDGQPRRPAESSDERDNASATALAGWMLAAWFIGLSAAVPLYTPFPRLTLPWVVSTWLGAGLAISALARRATQKPLTSAETDPQSVRSVLVQTAALWVLAISFLFLPSGSGAGMRDRSGLRHAADEIHREVLTGLSGESGNGEVDAVIYVVGEPALFFHLALLAEASSKALVVLPTDTVPASPQQTAVPVFMVLGFQASRLGQVSAVEANQWQLLAAVDYRPSDLVLLNHVSPARLREQRDAPPELVRLYGGTLQIAD